MKTTTTTREYDAEGRLTKETVVVIDNQAPAYHSAPVYPAYPPHVAPSITWTSPSTSGASLVDKEKLREAFGG